MGDRAKDNGTSKRILLIESAEDSTEIQRERLQRTAGRRLRPIILGLAVVAFPALVFASIVSNRGDDSQIPGAADSVKQAETAEPDADNPIRDPADPEPGELQDYAVNGDDITRNNRYSPVAAALDDVLATGSFGTGNRSNVFSGPTNELSYKITNPSAVTSIVLDASGRWAAGSYQNSFGLDVLVLGRVSESTALQSPWEFSAIAIGTNGFAWHPTAPGTIAYAENNLTQSTTVTVRDFTTERPTTQRFSAEFPGQLSVWGDWGFAFRQPGPLLFTSVGAIPDELLPTGINPLTVIAEDIPGMGMGMIAPGRLLIDGGETATILNVRNAVFEENTWFEPTEQVVSFRESPDDRFSVGLLIDRADGISDRGWVVLFTADPESAVRPAEPLFFASGPTVFDWTASGRFVAGYQPTTIGPEGNRISAASVTVYDLERALSVGRDIRIDGGAEGTADPDLRLSIDSLAFSEPVPD